MVETEQIRGWVQSIEAAAMPDPVWIPGKRVFEYEEVTREVVAFLKIARATQSLESLPLLVGHGLLSDASAIMRVIDECVNDVLFLLEGNPETADNVDRFVDHFRSTTIDNTSTSGGAPVPRSKIQNAAARSFPAVVRGQVGSHGELEKKMSSLGKDIWATMCHSVHSNYAEIMQMYGPVGRRARFQLKGREADAVDSEYYELIGEMKLNVALALWYIAMKLGIGELAIQIEDVIAGS